MFGITSETLLELNHISIIMRMLLAFFIGGTIGMERGFKGSPAGLRTHILVAIGSSLVMITNQYLTGMFEGVDPARMGAQVISGIGFLGAGTIIVTTRNQIKGLTTAATLWASACLGLAIGIGFYEAAIVAWLFILLVTILLEKFSERIQNNAKALDLYIEFTDTRCITYFVRKMREKKLQIDNLEPIPLDYKQSEVLAMMVRLSSDSLINHEELLELVSEVKGVSYVDIIEK